MILKLVIAIIIFACLCVSFTMSYLFF